MNNIYSLEREPTISGGVEISKHTKGKNKKQMAWMPAVVPHVLDIGQGIAPAQHSLACCECPKESCFHSSIQKYKK